MFKNPNFLKFCVFPSYHPLKLKIQKMQKIIFWYSNLVSQCAILSSWDNLEPSYAQKRVFDICPPQGGRGRNFTKPRLSGDQGLTTNLYTKIRNPIFHKSVRAVLSQWMSYWVIEWEDALFYMHKLKLSFLSWFSLASILLFSIVTACGNLLHCHLLTSNFSS